MKPWWLIRLGYVAFDIPWNALVIASRLADQGGLAGTCFYVAWLVVDCALLCNLVTEAFENSPDPESEDEEDEQEEADFEEEADSELHHAMDQLQAEHEKLQARLHALEGSAKREHAALSERIAAQDRRWDNVASALLRLRRDHDGLKVRLDGLAMGVLLDSKQSQSLSEMVEALRCDLVVLETAVRSSTSSTTTADDPGAAP